MCKGLLIFVFYVIIVSGGLVFAEVDKTADYCNKFHRIAVIVAGSSDKDVQYVLKELQDTRLPHGFELYEVEDEKEAQQDKFFGILFLNYQKTTTGTMWIIRNKAHEDRIEIQLKTKNKHCSSNWENISEEGYRRPGPSSYMSDYEGQMAINKIPTMEMSCAECKSLDVTLIDLLKDEDREVRKYAAVRLKRLGDVKRTAELLIDLLKDEDREVRKYAAGTLIYLGRLGDINAVEPLIDLLKDEDREVRRDVADRLGKLSDINAVGPLIDKLKDEDPGVRWHASLALRSIQVSKTSMDEDYFGEDPIKWREWWEKYKSKKN